MILILYACSVYPSRLSCFHFSYGYIYMMIITLPFPAFANNFELNNSLAINTWMRNVTKKNYKTINYKKYFEHLAEKTSYELRLHDFLGGGLVNPRVALRLANDLSCSFSYSCVFFFASLSDLLSLCLELRNMNTISRLIGNTSREPNIPVTIS